MKLLLTSAGVTNKVYAIDDESAIKVDGGVEVISNGSCKFYSH